jgi:hypothetical protein
MSNSSLTSRRIRPGQVPFRALREGYRDARAGVPFRRDMTLAPEIVAANYERGRLVVANIRAAGISPPAWNAMDQRPAAVTAAIRRAIQTVGSVVPTRRAKDPVAAPQDPVVVY